MRRMALGLQHIRSAIAKVLGPWRRIGIVVLGLAMVVLSKGFWELKESQAYFPLFWPFWFGVAAGLLFAFAAKPQSTPLYQASGLFLVTAMFSRVAGAYLNLINEVGNSHWMAVIAITVYILAGFGMWRFWIREVGPWHDRYRMSMKSGGD